MKRSSATSGRKKTTAVITVEGLIEQGNKALSSMAPELAANFYRRALAMAPQNTNIMDALADALIQIGDTPEALDLLVQSTSIAPHENPFKWLYLAQLQNGSDALESFNRAIAVLSCALTEHEHVDEVCS